MHFQLSFSHYSMFTFLDFHSLLFSSNITATTGKIPPNAPVLNIATDCSYQSVKLRWSFLRSQNEASELTYELQMKSNGTRYVVLYFKRMKYKSLNHT